MAYIIIGIIIVGLIAGIKLAALFAIFAGIAALSLGLGNKKKK